MLLALACCTFALVFTASGTALPSQPLNGEAIRIPGFHPPYIYTATCVDNPDGSQTVSYAAQPKPDQANFVYGPYSPGSWTVAATFTLGPAIPDPYYLSIRAVLDLSATFTISSGATTISGTVTHDPAAPPPPTPSYSYYATGFCNTSGAWFGEVYTPYGLWQASIGDADGSIADQGTVSIAIQNVSTDYVIRLEFTSLPPDANGDGIVDSLQPSGTPTGSFADNSLSPPTTGSIVDTGGLSVQITDAASAADGVKITVGAGSGQATFSACGSTLTVAAGSEVVVTCGSIKVQVVSGAAEVRLGGGLVVVSVPAGVTAKVTDTGGGGFFVENLGGGVVTVTVDGVSVTVPGGGSSSVKTWDFQGFSQPVDNPATLNVVKAGQAVPLKWRLLDGAGQPVTNLASAKLTVSTLTCSLGASADQLEEVAAGGSGLLNLGNGNYQLNWKSAKSYADSCKTLQLDVGDGVTHDALFKFAK